MIEVVVAIALLMVLCLQVFYLFNQGSSGTMRVRDEIAAINYAMSVLNYCKALPLSSALLEECENKTVSSLRGARATILSLPDGYSCELTVKSSKSADVANYTYKVLIVKIGWVSRGVTRYISLSDLHYGASPND